MTALPNPRIPVWTLGERLGKARRDNTKFNQAEMGALLAVSKATVSSWESDARRPQDLLGTLRRWAEITGTDYRWLAFGEPETGATRRKRRPVSDQHKHLQESHTKAA